MAESAIRYGEIINALTEQQKSGFLDKLRERLKLQAECGRNIAEPEIIKLSNNFCSPRGEYLLDSINVSVLMSCSDPTKIFQDSELFIRELENSIQKHVLGSDDRAELARNFIIKLGQDAILLQNHDTGKITKLIYTQKQTITENVGLLLVGLQNGGENIDIEFVEEAIASLESIVPIQLKIIINESLYETIEAIFVRVIDRAKSKAVIKKRIENGNIERSLDLIDLNIIDEASYKDSRSVYCRLSTLTGFVSSKIIIAYLKQLHDSGNITVDAYYIDRFRMTTRITRWVCEEEQNEFFNNCFELLRQYDQKSEEAGKKARLDMLGDLRIASQETQDGDPSQSLNTHKLTSNIIREAEQYKLILEGIGKDELKNLLILSARMESLQLTSSTYVQLNDMIKKFNDETIGFALANEGECDTPIRKSPQLLKRLIENIVLRDDTLDDYAKLALVEQTYIKLGFLPEPVIAQDEVPDTRMMLGSAVKDEVITQNL